MQNIHRSRLAMLIAVTLLPLPALAAESYDNCTGFIDSVPATISTQGTWCLRQDLATGMSSGTAITIAANNVTIDCNDFKIGGLGAGPGTQANGLTAMQILNTTVRNCNVRGFVNGVLLTGAGHVVEDNRFDGNTVVGINVTGDGSVVARNLVRDTGGSTTNPGLAIGIATDSSVDVRDNTVTGVMPEANTSGNGNAVGIFTNNNPNASIGSNRVRSLVAMGTGTTTGILNSNSGRIAITGNQVIGTGVDSVGLSCSSANGRAAANVVNGFATPISGCADDGNVTAP
ncbi:MAG: right-handed parallel beta-helix repeat-containing protein [Pseudomonadota bacterium]|nr:right-handed parallel beta-helix repeat-containing protein [Pseudomonadota bacterium]